MSCTETRQLGHVLLGLSLAWALAACEQERAAGIEDDVLATQTERFRAIVEADVDTLDAILAPELVYIHSHGGVDTKDEFIESLSSGRVDYLELAPKDVQIRLYENSAVVTGDISLRVAAGGQEHQLAMRFTEVYVYNDNRWQLVSWQSTGIP